MNTVCQYRKVKILFFSQGGNIAAIWEIRGAKFGPGKFNALLY